MPVNNNNTVDETEAVRSYDVAVAPPVVCGLSMGEILSVVYLEM